MKNKLFLPTLFLLFLVSGCAALSKGKPEATHRMSLAEVQCQTSCQVMAKCSARSGNPYSDHDMVTCSLQCMSAQPALRAAVAQCSVDVLIKDCDPAKMHLCVRSKIMSLQQ